MGQLKKFCVFFVYSDVRKYDFILIELFSNYCFYSESVYCSIQLLGIKKIDVNIYIISNNT